MLRYLTAGLVALLPIAANAQTEQQQLVDRAALASQELLNDRDGTDAQFVLRRARAVMICPQIFRAGFLFGGQGGTCVLSARDAAGSWSGPAFYALGGASFGFQAGIQDAEAMFFIMNDRALRAVMDSQLKLGADARSEGRMSATRSQRCCAITPIGPRCPMARPRQSARCCSARWKRSARNGSPTCRSRNSCSASRIPAQSTHRR